MITAKEIERANFEATLARRLRREKAKHGIELTQFEALCVVKKMISDGKSHLGGTNGKSNDCKKSNLTPRFSARGVLRCGLFR